MTEKVFPKFCGNTLTNSLFFVNQCCAFCGKYITFARAVWAADHKDFPCCRPRMGREVYNKKRKSYSLLYDVEFGPSCC